LSISFELRTKSYVTGKTLKLRILAAFFGILQRRIGASAYRLMPESSGFSPVAF